jgi:hypothetical protein
MGGKLEEGSTTQRFAIGPDSLVKVQFALVQTDDGRRLSRPLAGRPPLAPELAERVRELLAVSSRPGIGCCQAVRRVADDERRTHP